MKTLVLLAVIALGAYYWKTHQEAPPAPVVVDAPKPTPRKVYYHSPLDAPALSTGIHSGTGYSSRNRNTNWRGSHMSDGTAPRTALPDDPPALDAEDSYPPR